MNIQHAKSPCCRATIQHFGKRRRRCSQCHKTWRIRKKKRGRKLKRTNEQLIVSYLQKRSPPLRISAHQKGRSKSRLQRELNRSLKKYIKEHGNDWLSLLKHRGKLIAIADAIWYRVHGQKYTIYIILLRPLNTNQAVICPPLTVVGHEGLLGWKAAFDGLPANLKTRIAGVVCDGAGSLVALIKFHGWIVQRCHFHLIAAVQNYLTTGPRSLNRKYACEVMGIVQKFLVSRKPESFLQKLEVVRQLSRSRGLRRVLNGLILNYTDYHSYQKYPGLHLPATSNSAESCIQCIRDLMYRCRGFRSLAALQYWLTAIIIFKSTIRCNGKDQPN